MTGTVRLVVGRDVVRPGHIVGNIGIKLGQGPASLKLSVSTVGLQGVRQRAPRLKEYPNTGLLEESA